ncbi:hypothetical protein [Legionella tunisiensis]|uniref:hypothetical protein n=1 Tax=Legionella tunisiensis TaxID=1034944 RepID=UPI000363C9DE|nr:hypothetical protein [Legionella tunisiensis]
MNLYLTNNHYFHHKAQLINVISKLQPNEVIMESKMELNEENTLSQISYTLFGLVKFWIKKIELIFLPGAPKIKITKAIYG